MKEVHLICNSHIDPIWQWDWPEGASAVLSTFKAAVNIAEEFDYIFCHNEVTVYKYVEEYAPEMFAKIQQLVKEGKWHIMGGWYLQPDCNLPSGESLVRQILVGKKYFLEKFNKFPTTAINFDPFGHSRGLVQIIKKCGQDSYLFTRPMKGQLALESEQFIWEGFDGSRIKANRCNGYGTILGGAGKMIKDRAEEQSQDVICVLWGLGNHGAGPSRKDLKDIEELQAEGAFTYVHSTPETFFAKIDPQYVVDKSLHICNPGCYTSMSRLKKKYVNLENELFFTEKILSVANLKGLAEYPQEKFDKVVEDMLNVQFHDVLPGTSVKAGETNALHLLGHGLLECERLKMNAFFALSNEQEIAKEGEYPILVFNPHPYEWKTNVVCEYSLADANNDSTVESKPTIIDSKGNKIPCQIIKEESDLNVDWRKRIIFEATLPPLSVDRFGLYLDFPKKQEKKKTNSFLFDNGRKFVEIDPKTGLLKSYKINGVEYLKNGFQPIMYDDNPDPWAMQDFQLKGFWDNPQAFRLSEKPHGIFENMKNIQILEDGDILFSVEAFFELEDSKARIEYRIYKNNDDVDVLVDVSFGNINRMLKLEIPVSMQGKLIGQAPFGIDALFTDGRENVAQRFIAINDDEKCLAIFNDGTYGNSFMDGKLYISLLRGISYCAHPMATPPIIPDNRFVKKVDQGENSFSFRISVCQENELERKALEFNQKPFSVNVFPIQDKVENKPFDIRISNKNICIQTIKKAETTTGFIIRLINNSSEIAQTSLLFGTEGISMLFGKYEVKTVIYDGKNLYECTEFII